MLSGGKRFQRQLWEPGEWGKDFPQNSFCTIEYWGDPGSRPLQRQEDALMVPNPRACSRGGSTLRDSSGSLASGEKISPRIVFCTIECWGDPGSRPLQRQEDAWMVPNPRACSRGGSAPRDSSGSLASGEKISPRIVFCTIEYWGDPGSRPLQRQEDALTVPNPRASSRGGSAPRDSFGSLASGKNISSRIISVRSNTGETPVVDRYSAKKMP